MKNSILIALVALAAVISCTSEEPDPMRSDPGIPSPDPDVDVYEEDSDAIDDGVTLSGSFAGPESVLHDPEQDVYFVSNINGPMTAKDDNGFISRIQAADQRIEPKWIDGTREDVTLDAPKGMALVNDELWVTDITVVRRFDKSTGKELGVIAVPGSVFLNDLAPFDGSVYVSDSGMEGKTEGTRSKDAVYRIASDETVETVASGTNLHRPNGLVATPEGPWVVSFGSDELYRLVKGEKSSMVKLPQGSLDGIVQLEGGDFLISSWDANGVYRGPESGPFELVVTSVSSPADIGFDVKRRLLLLPHVEENEVSFHRVPR